MDNLLLLKEFFMEFYYFCTYLLITYLLHESGLRPDLTSDSLQRTAGEGPDGTVRDTGVV